MGTIQTLALRELACQCKGPSSLLNVFVSLTVGSVSGSFQGTVNKRCLLFHYNYYILTLYGFKTQVHYYAKNGSYVNARGARFLG